MKDAIKPLPNQLLITDESTFITFKSKFCCKYNYPKARTGTSRKDLIWGLARASHPLPTFCRLFYYEVKILHDGKTKEIEIGITEKEDYESNVGYDGIGYRGCNGMLYESIASNGRVFGPTFAKADVIGCGVNLTTNQVFFTKNGEMIGLTNQYLSPGDLSWFPAVSLKAKNAKVEINFGELPFIFEICK